MYILNKYFFLNLVDLFIDLHGLTMYNKNTLKATGREGEKMKYKRASYCVSYLSRKYSANKVWIWDTLEEMYNIIKGTNALLTEEEYKELEQYISKNI